MVQGSNIAATFQCMSVRSASYLSAGTAFSSPSSCIGLVRSDGSAFYSKTAPQYKVHCSFPASKPASQPVLLLWDFTRCLITILISSLHISSAEVFAIGNDNHMQRYCRMPFFFSLPPPASRVILCWSAGLKETTFCHGK